MDNQPNINILTINPEFVCNFILRAKEFHAKEQVTFTEKTPETEYEYDWAQILADHKDDLTYQELKNNMVTLTLDKKIDLLTLMYIGRRDFGLHEWGRAREIALSYMPDNLTDYLLARPLIAEYLEEALGLLGYSCNDVE